MTADLHQAITAKPRAKATTSGPATSPPRKNSGNNELLPNPQQGMADPAASVSANTTGAATSNTACTSPLTVTSLEAAAAATAAANGGCVPQVVSQVVPAVPQPQTNAQQPPTVESMLDKLSIQQHPPPHAASATRPTPMEDKKMRIRTPPTEHDNRKLFVGGLPTDVSDHDFLEFFQQFGDVIDSVVIIDRLTKRSRGFGFVTFATEKFANSLLTAIPGKTGYVVINGKQCEVKASTPKSDEGSYKHGHHGHHHHGAPGMWRSNPPRHDHRGYVPRINSAHVPANRGAATAHAKPPPALHQQYQKQPSGGKQYSIDNEFNGDVDGRNFDELYQPPAQMNAGGYQPTMYGRSMSGSNLPVYNQNYQNYQNMYNPVPPNAYAYSGGSGASGGSVPSSWDASYPAAGPNQGYSPYASGAMGNGGGYYDPYAVQQYNQYGNGSSVPPPVMMGQMGYATYGGGYGDGGASQGSGDEYHEHYPQAYADDVGGYDHADAAEQYE